MGSEVALDFPVDSRAREAPVTISQSFLILVLKNTNHTLETAIYQFWALLPELLNESDLKVLQS